MDDGGGGTRVAEMKTQLMKEYKRIRRSKNRRKKRGRKREMRMMQDGKTGARRGGGDFKFGGKTK